LSDSHDTEVDAYIFIKEDLKEKGWDTRNPGRSQEGEVFTQNEVFSHKELKKQLGRDKPENVVKLDETHFWPIEAKRSLTELQKALDEAINYSDKINKSKSIKALIASGVAGNSADGYITKSVFFNGKKYVPITRNGKEISGLLPKDIAKRILQNKRPDLVDIPIDKALFLSKAEKINAILHLGAINKNDRAIVMASLLLSLVDDTVPNRNAAPSVLISEINSRARRILKKHGKENFADFIEIALPPTEDNHTKFKNAIVQSLQELESLDIRSAMNAGDDVLGEFYEVFLKYGNGAKEIGIVLTPRHITRFASEVVDVNNQDLVYDPTCGTGGFLVAALDLVKRKLNNDSLWAKFRKNKIFGIDQDSVVIAFALVNMIFRGDGNTNIDAKNCFQNHLQSLTTKEGLTAEFTKKSKKNSEPVTKVLMNPPFALKTSDEKEYKFVEHALKQMENGGILFSILPSSAMIKAGKVLAWRQNLLKNNTLLAVITFPPELFYPIGQHTVGVFIKKGIPHNNIQNVFWIRAIHDGLVKRKGKRLHDSKEPNDLEKIKNDLRSFLQNPTIPIKNILEFQKACTINESDKYLELVPEAYIDQKEPTTEEIEDGVENLIRETAAFLIRSKKENDFLDETN